MTNLILKNRNLLPLGQWLSGLSLPGRESRERTKFCMLLQEQIALNEQFRLKLLEVYGEKDEDGKLKVIEENNNKHYNVPDDTIPEFNKELDEYMDRAWSPSEDGMKARLKVIKSLVLDTDREIAAPLAPEYNEWCEAFEKINDEPVVEAASE